MFENWPQAIVRCEGEARFAKMTRHADEYGGISDIIDHLIDVRHSFQNKIKYTE